MNEINRDNFRLLLAAFIEKEELAVRKVARAIGCSDPTLTRILAGKTHPTDEMMKQGGILFELGFDRYSTLSAADRETLSEKIGAASGGVLGFGSITAAIGLLGVPGFSAVGVTSGLSVLGGIVGGGMLVGVSVAAAIPLAAGAMGFALIKGIKYLVSERNLDSTELDALWELPLPGGTSTS